MYSGPVVVFQTQMAPLADAAAAREPSKERATCSTSDQRTLGGGGQGVGEDKRVEKIRGGRDDHSRVGIRGSGDARLFDLGTWYIVCSCLVHMCVPKAHDKRFGS